VRFVKAIAPPGFRYTIRFGDLWQPKFTSIAKPSDHSVETPEQRKWRNQREYRWEEAGEHFSHTLRSRVLQATCIRDGEEKQIEPQAWGAEHSIHDAEAAEKRGRLSSAQWVRHFVLSRDGVFIPDNDLPYWTHLSGCIVYVDRQLFEEWLNTAPSRRPDAKLPVIDFLNAVLNSWSPDYAPPTNDQLKRNMRKYCDHPLDKIYDDWRKVHAPNDWKRKGVRALPRLSDEDCDRYMAEIHKRLIAEKT